MKLKVDETDRNIQFVGEQKKILTHKIPVLKAARFLKSCCEGYLAFIADDK